MPSNFVDLDLPSTFKVGDVVRVSESVNTMWKYQEKMNMDHLNDWCFITEIMKDNVGKTFKIDAVSASRHKVINSEDSKIYSLICENKKEEDEISYVGNYYFTDKMLVKHLHESKRKEVYL